jgi:hypothetical protein
VGDVEAEHQDENGAHLENGNCNDQEARKEGRGRPVLKNIELRRSSTF